MFPSFFRSRNHDKRAARLKLERRRRFAVEPLEGRQMLSTFTVTNTNNSGTNSLRWAINQSNGTAGPNTINFNIPGSYLHTINLQSALPTISTSVTINGTSEAGYAGSPLVILNGSAAGSSAAGLTLTASNNTVKGLAIDSFASDGVLVSSGSNDLITADVIGVTVPGATGPLPSPSLRGDTPAGNGGDGVHIEGPASKVTILNDVISANSGDGVAIVDASSTVIAGDKIGTTLEGTAALGNSTDGIYLILATGTTIGGTTASARDVISGNAFDGLVVDESTSTLVEGVSVGTDPAGEGTVGNGFDGVLILDSSNTTIGGTTTARNVISGNSGNGVEISDSSGSVVQYAYIGIDASGKTNAGTNGASLGNGDYGVNVEGSSANTTLGGTVAGAGDVISGNASTGVDISSSSNVLVAGDDIGTNAAGNSALPNSFGLYADFTTGLTLGGTTSAARDVISGNTYDGVQLALLSGAVIEGNDIGTDATGEFALGNGSFGVSLVNSNNDTVGGTAAGAGNVISANGSDGIEISDSANCLVAGNRIGTDASGSKKADSNGKSFGNAGNGVTIYGGSTGNTIGGTSGAARNVISDNAGWGVYISDSGTSGNLVEGDDIGTNLAGMAALPNAHNGLDIVSGATNNTVGGTAIGAGNLISGNAYNGVDIAFAGTSNNTVEGNLIGTNYNGTAPLANGANGVVVDGGATNNIIGGTSGAARDIISSNGSYGVEITDSGTSGNLVEGDYIGVSATGTGALANHFGVGILSGASNNTVGSTADYNVISSNAWDGVQLLGSGTSYNLVQGNLIGTNYTGSGALPNFGSGVAIAQGASNNTVGGQGGSRELNVISGNGGDGVYVSDPGTSANTIQYNFIGTDYSGENPVSNAQDGVLIQSGASSNAVYNDLISANDNDGVLVTGGNTTNNSVNGDWIGLDASGTRGVNQLGQQYSNLDGVVISGGACNTYVGGDTISGNFNGVVITSGETSSSIVYDQIGTGADGTTYVGNVNNGVVLDGVTGNTVEYDLFVYNGDVGILGDSGSNPSNNTVANDTYFVTVNGVTYGNTDGRTLFE